MRRVYALHLMDDDVQRLLHDDARARPRVRVTEIEQPPEKRANEPR
jgi:hypothetical protein